MKKLFAAVLIVLLMVIVNATPTIVNFCVDDDVGIGLAINQDAYNFNFVSSENAGCQEETVLKYPTVEATFTFDNNNFPDYQMNISTQYESYENWSVTSNNTYINWNTSGTKISELGYDTYFLQKVKLQGKQESGIFRLDIGEL